MKFECDNIISGIKDIKEIYDVNDKTYDSLQNSIEQLNKDLFLSTMSEEMFEKYEDMLNLEPLPSDTLDTRRENIKNKIADLVFYSYRVIEKRLNAILRTTNGEYYTFTVDVENQMILFRLGLECKQYKTVVDEFLDSVAPLNLSIYVYIDYNKYGTVKNFSFGDLQTGVHDDKTGFTYQEMYDTALHLYITALS